MKAWRKQVEAWPVVVPQAMDPASAPLWMQDPEEAKAFRRGLGRTLFRAILVGFLLPAAPLFMAVALLFVDRFAEAIVLGAIGLAGFVLVPWFATLAGIERWDAQRGRRIVDALLARDERVLGGDFVRVAYGEGLWRHPVFGDDMDHGVLRIDFDRLTFVGRHTRFELPASAVIGTEIRRAPGPPSLAPFRLFVTWTDGAETKTLSVGFPYRRSPARRVAEVAELRERIEAWRQERRPVLGTERSFLAPPRIDGLHARPSTNLAVGRTAKIVAALLVVPLCGVFLGLVTGLFKSLGLEMEGVLNGVLSGLLGPLAGLLWVYSVQKVERRLPERYRYKEPPTILPVADLPSADLGAPHSEARDETHLRA